ncbi:MAG: nuclear transport factor 2 family protein [Actinomycetota bacterium]|nr:nuclear transport factor 2 family protein [Actinomycetota bacterium]
MTGKLDEPASATAAAFVQQFREVWAAPTIGRLDALTHPDVCYTQPLIADVRGREQASAYWRRVFTLMPDLHIDVVNWAVSADNLVYIEFLIKGTLGGTSVSVPAIDRYELDGSGRVRRRILYCDALTMAASVVRRPRALAALLRQGTRIILAAGISAIQSTRRGGDR